MINSHNYVCELLFHMEPAPLDICMNRIYLCKKLYFFNKVES